MNRKHGIRMAGWIVAVVMSMASPLKAADIYCATNGTGGNGSSWALPYTNLQTALDIAGPNDAIYLAAHTFGIRTQLLWKASAQGVAIRGGYTGDGTPGSFSNVPTVIVRTAGNWGVLKITGVTNGVLAQVTITGGNEQNYNVNAGGGGLNIQNCSNLTVASCVISNNSYAQTGGSPGAYGGGVYSAGSTVAFTNCLFRRNTASYGNGGYGGGLYVASGQVTLRDVIFDNNTASGRPAWDNGSAFFANGPVSAYNCLIFGSVGAGSAVYAPTNVTLVNCTVAYNQFAGLQRNGGLVAVSNSIFWGNADDVTGAVALVSCDLRDGDSNGVAGCFSADPAFEYGFYLGSGSPCVNTGSTTAAAAGLDGHTTRIDGTADSGTLDIGFHYATGFPLTYADIYVATNGNNASSGTNSAQALRTITKALTLAQDGSRIHVDAGLYATETFPLLLDGKAGLQVLGAGRTTTVINASGSNLRVMTLNNLIGNSRVEGLTLTGGKDTQYNGNYGGGGLYIVNSPYVTLASCVVSNNSVNHNNGSSSGRGGGIASFASIVSITNCLIERNFCNQSSYGENGGGLFLGSGTMDIQDSIFDNNSLGANRTNDQGVAIYSTGILKVRNCLFYENIASYGATIYANSPLLMQNCTVADSVCPGLRAEGNAVVVSHSIFWGNADDISGPASLAYCDIRDGDSNGVNGCFSSNPAFEPGGYYLTPGSPCVDNGAGSAVAAGVSGRTTQKDGTLDAGTVDLGWHYDQGSAAGGIVYTSIYVSAAGGSDASDGTNWPTAFRTLTRAFAKVIHGSTIYVGAGSYTNGAETFPLILDNKRDVLVLGTNRAVTVISPSGSTRRAFTFNNVGGVSRLEGVTITGGLENKDNAAFGGAIFINNCPNLTIASCALVTNSAATGGGSTSGRGGALYIAGPSGVTVSNCVIARNNASYATSGGQGGGIFAGGGSLTVCDTVLNHNTIGWSTSTDQGSALYIAAAASLRNCLVFGNIDNGGSGSALYLASGSLAMQNGTVAYHNGPGVRVAAGSAALTHSILWGNRDDVTGSVALVACDIRDGDSNGVAGCMSADPRFEYGYYLGDGSPCVNAGNATAAAAGLDARTTGTNGAPDMGAVDLGWHYEGALDMASVRPELYVSASAGSDSNSGTTPGAPFKTITKAFSQATDGTRIYLAAGSYTNRHESFPLALSYKAGVRILGEGKDSTLIQAVATNARVMTLTGLTGDSRLEGVTLTGGKDVQIADYLTAGGGGLMVYNSAGLTVGNCALTNNEARPFGGNAYNTQAGGLLLVSSAMTVTNTTIERNTCSYNNVNVFGCGVSLRYSQLTALNCIVRNNTNAQSACLGGGVFVDGGSSLVLRNCLVTGNDTGFGDGLYAAAGSAMTVESCTLAGNGGQGIYKGGNVSAVNSILWQNGDDVVGAFPLAYCDVEDGDSNGVSGCISADPLFKNPGSGDYRLAAGSPCINQGVWRSWMPGSLDLAGKPRKQGAAPDMGAYESSSSGMLLLVR